MRELIYLASPYSDPDSAVIEQRYRGVLRILARLTLKGLICYSPIVHNHHIEIGKDWQVWERIDSEFLRRCDRLIVVKLQGWEQSRGVQAEIELAKSRSLPIEYMEP